ncbi:hypothetical protein [Dyella sp. ASV21]|uniref:hypothetical protein n=1 Tax=Dyella sp. ASV21 TaxID=2795114 RepID=UPI0018EAF637|nr:hypothetical protein [Dyella sp. ASV21]
MTQQVNNLQQAKNQLNKARSMMEEALALVRRSRGDMGLAHKISSGIESVHRATKHADMQCSRIIRKTLREIRAVEKAKAKEAK